MKPVIALVGRPNVGKSTLFNRFTGSRDAIVADFSGLTRDRHYGDATINGREFIVIDTGGFEPESATGIVHEMAKQTQQAVAEADAVIFVVDSRAGISAQDHEIAQYLRPLGKPIIVAANKSEGMQAGIQTSEFYELGLGEPLPVAAAHGRGISDLMELLIERIDWSLFEEDAQTDPDAEEGADKVIRLAVAGRPNVGKSTLINTWLGEERLIAFDLAGTTRDAITVPFEHRGQAYELIDTAGLRRKGKVFEGVEKISVVKTLQAIDRANVVVLLLDATQGVTEQDAHIASYILEKGRAVVVAVNKWDALDDYQKQLVTDSIDSRLRFLRFAKVLKISALKKKGLTELWKALETAYKSAFSKMATPKLTRALYDAVEFQQPQRSGRFRPKMRYAHQGGSNPPIIVVHGSALEHVTDAYKRYLEGRFRETFDLHGTPLRIEFRSSHNPYTEGNRIKK